MMKQGMTDLHRDVETVARGAEVRAVVDAMKAGTKPKLGDIFNYALDLPASLCKRKTKYQFAVEQWHLDAARETVRGNPLSQPLMPSRHRIQ